MPGPTEVHPQPAPFRPRRIVRLRLMLWALLAGFALAQTTASASPSTLPADLPTVSLERFALAAGDDLVVRATGLEPGSSYTLTATPPNGGTGDGSEVRGEVEADAEGRFDYALRLLEAGRWQLAVTGPGLEAVRFWVTVEGASPAETPSGPPATAPSATQAAPPSETPSSATPSRAPSPNDEPDATDPDSAEPGASEPGATQPNLAATTPDDFRLEQGAVVAEADGREAWRLAFPPGSGETRALLRQDGALYLGHGNSLLELDPASGAVRARWLLPGQITGLEPTAGGVRALSALPDGLGESFTLAGGSLQEPVRFGSDPAPYGWLRQEAEVPDPLERAERDATNPWLLLAAGRAAAPDEAEGYYERAVEAGATFYDLAGLARELYALGQVELAETAMDRALRDFAERGYDPRLLEGRFYHDLYNFPLASLEQALASGDQAAADFWGRWLAYFATPRASEVRSALLEHAAALQDEGRTEEAGRLRASLRPAGAEPVSTAPQRTALSLGRSGWPLALALLLAFFALHLVLAAKYARAQAINLERRRVLSRKVGPLSPLLLMRYYSFTEKLVLLLLLVGVLLCAALAAWAERGRLPAAETELFAGSLATPTARARLAEFQGAEPRWQGIRSDFVEGYLAQVAGDAEDAAARYAAAENDAGALNNLGALREDPALFERALEWQPGLPEARYNLGEAAEGFAFARDYRPGESVLVVPSRRDLQLAAAGDWNTALGELFARPWPALQDARPTALHPVLWGALALLVLLLVLVNALWLFVPRMRWVRQAPRTPAYHLLALLVPGSGLADEMWGLLLIVPWAVAGLGALAESLGWPLAVGGLGFRASLIALGVVYLVNVVAVTIEYVSYRRRMQVLKRDQPSLAQEFGLLRT